MTYQRFTLPQTASVPATLATPGTLLQTVTEVATVSGLNDSPQVFASAADWLDVFEERAAIREYEGGFNRPEAERLAWTETVNALGPPNAATSLVLENSRDKPL